MRELRPAREYLTYAINKLFLHMKRMCIFLCLSFVTSLNGKKWN